MNLLTTKITKTTYSVTDAERCNVSVRPIGGGQYSDIHYLLR